MTTRSNNPPHSTLDLTKEEHELLDETLEANLRLGLGMLQTMTATPVAKDRKQAELLVGRLELWRSIKRKLEKSHG